jgi:hypothetical protein
MRAARLLAAAALLATVAGPWTGAAEAAGDRAGDAVVIAPGGGPLDHGGSRTAFRLELPSGAACPGDSANDDYRIQSFLVPDDVDPADLTYESTKPAGEGNWALYEVTSNPFVQILTNVAVNPGDPGVIDAIPPLDFAVFPPGTLADGRHHVGIACTLFNETTTYWDTDVELTNSADDEPAQLTWVALDAPAGAGSSSSKLPLWLGLGAVAVLAVGGGVVLARRRSATAPATGSGP